MQTNRESRASSRFLDSFLRNSYEPVSLTMRKLYYASIFKINSYSSALRLHNMASAAKSYSEGTTINITAEFKICLNGLDCNTNEDCVLGSTCSISISSHVRKACVYDDSFDLSISNITCAIRNQECSPTNGCCNPSLSCSSISNTCLPMVPPACVVTRVDGKKFLP